MPRQRSNQANGQARRQVRAPARAAGARGPGRQARARARPAATRPGAARQPLWTTQMHAANAFAFAIHLRPRARALWRKPRIPGAGSAAAPLARFWPVLTSKRPCTGDSAPEEGAEGGYLQLSPQPGGGDPRLWGKKGDARPRRLDSTTQMRSRVMPTRAYFSPVRPIYRRALFGQMSHSSGNGLCARRAQSRCARVSCAEAVARRLPAWLPGGTEATQLRRPSALHDRCESESLGCD
jgi:hypothetical protein